MGDAKLVAVMGLFLGSAIAPAVLVGFATGAVVGGAMLAMGFRGAQEGRPVRAVSGPRWARRALGGATEIVHWYVTTFFGGS